MIGVQAECGSGKRGPITKETYGLKRGNCRVRRVRISHWLIIKDEQILQAKKKVFTTACQGFCFAAITFL